MGQLQVAGSPSKTCTLAPAHSTSAAVVGEAVAALGQPHADGPPEELSKRKACGVWIARRAVRSGVAMTCEPFAQAS